MSSPGQDKRLKRNAHVKAQSIIRQQVSIKGSFLGKTLLTERL